MQFISIDTNIMCKRMIHCAINTIVFLAHHSVFCDTASVCQGHHVAMR